MAKKQETFEFGLDIGRLPEGTLVDMEDQILTEVKKRFGDDYSGDDVERYRYIFKAEVTVNKKE